MNKANIEKAKKLRKSMTPQEHKIWSLVRNNQLAGYRFKRQFPIGNYIVDFVCSEKLLIIEIDGGGHNTNEQIQYDLNRTKYLESRGFQVLRFWNNDVDENIEGVFEVISSYLIFNNSSQKHRHLTPTLSSQERE